MKSLRTPFITTLLAFALASFARFPATASSSTLPDGTEFPTWEQPLQFTKTYYVDGQAKNADDSGPGTKEQPFKTINTAAQVLQPGERVVIEVGVDTASGLGKPRPVAGHTLDVHNLMVHGNVFFGMGRSAIEFTNARNDADGNVYANPTGNPRFGQPFLRVKFPEPPEWHNLISWREEHGWDKNGAMADITAELDPDKLELTLTVEGDVKSLPAFKGITTDFFGNPVSGDRAAGPFSDMMTNTGARSIDPR